MNKNFDYSLYCPYDKADASLGVTDADIFASGREPQKHKWHTENEAVCWRVDHAENGANYFSASVSAMCLFCGAKTSFFDLAESLTNQEKENFERAYSKEKFNSGELFSMLQPHLRNLRKDKIINMQSDHGKYWPDRYVSNYCPKSPDFKKHHMWHTEQDKLSWYSEPCGESPLVKGYCILCGAKSDSLAISYPTHDKNEIIKLNEDFSKDKFNQGEYSINCWTVFVKD